MHASNFNSQVDRASESLRTSRLRGASLAARCAVARPAGRVGCARRVQVVAAACWKHVQVRSSDAGDDTRLAQSQFRNEARHSMQADAVVSSAAPLCRGTTLPQHAGRPQQGRPQQSSTPDGCIARRIRAACCVSRLPHPTANHAWCAQPAPSAATHTNMAQSPLPCAPASVENDRVWFRRRIWPDRRRPGPVR